MKPRPRSWLVVLPALVLSSGVLVSNWRPSSRSSAAFGVAPALALSVDPNQVEPPRVFPAPNAPKNARILVLVTPAWLAKTFAETTKAATLADAQLELSDGLGQVPQQRSLVNGGRDGVMATPERALSPGALHVSLTIQGKDVELATLQVQDRVDEHAPVWPGPISVEGRAGIREAALSRIPQVELRAAASADRDSPNDELLYQIIARSLSYGVHGSTTLFLPVSDGGRLAGNWCFIDSYGVDVRGVDASIQVVDAAGHASASYRFAGRCERGTPLYPAEHTRQTRWWVIMIPLLLALLGAFFFLRSRRFGRR
jgi:hypothetical protein